MPGSLISRQGAAHSCPAAKVQGQAMIPGFLPSEIAPPSGALYGQIFHEGLYRLTELGLRYIH